MNFDVETLSTLSRSVYDAASAEDKATMESWTAENWSALEASVSAEREAADVASRAASVTAIAARASKVVVNAVPAAVETGSVERSAIIAADKFGQRSGPAFVQTVGDNANAKRMLGAVLGRSGYNEGTALAGGNLVPVEFSNEVIMKAANLTPFASNQFAYIYPMVSETAMIPVLTIRPAPSGTAIAESTAGTGGTRAQWGRVQMIANKFGDQFPLSDELLADSPIAVLEMLARLMSEGMAFTKENLFLNGSGALQPQGVLTAVTAAASGVAYVGTTDVALANAIEHQFGSLRAGYRSDAIWIMSPATKTSLDVLRGSTGLKLVGDPTQQGPWSVIKGKPVFESDACPDGSVILGNFKSGYAIGQRAGLVVKTSVEAGFATDELTVKYRERFDGKVTQLEAIKVLTGVPIV